MKILLLEIIFVCLRMRCTVVVLILRYSIILVLSNITTVSFRVLQVSSAA